MLSAHCFPNQGPRDDRINQRQQVSEGLSSEERGDSSHEGPIRATYCKLSCRAVGGGPGSLRGRANGLGPEQPTKSTRVQRSLSPGPLERSERWCLSLFRERHTGCVYSKAAPWKGANWKKLVRLLRPIALTVSPFFSSGQTP